MTLKEIQSRYSMKMVGSLCMRGKRKKNYGRWILMDSVEETRRYRSRKSTLDCELQVRKASS